MFPFDMDKHQLPELSCTCKNLKSSVIKFQTCMYTTERMYTNTYIIVYVVETNI